jgi:hypothetical protein
MAVEGGPDPAKRRALQEEQDVAAGTPFYTGLPGRSGLGCTSLFQKRSSSGFAIRRAALLAIFLLLGNPPMTTPLFLRGVDPNVCRYRLPCDSPELKARWRRFDSGHGGPVSSGFRLLSEPVECARSRWYTGNAPRGYAERHSQQI